jgi:histidinol-phosphate aminotransferase
LYAKIDPVAHGAPDFAELERLGFSPNDVLDFSANINPFGPSLRVREALDGLLLERYPDPESWALRRALAAHLGLETDRIMVGNGCAELIQLAALAFLRPGDRALVLGPTFGEYARAARLAGADVRHWNATPADGFAFDPSSIAAELAERYRVVFVCNPNNPTGQCIPEGLLADWATAHSQTLFVVDEAYLSFTPGVRSAIECKATNILVLRSMTKDYALAGLRLGYALGPVNLIDALVQVRPPWNVNALAQAAGLVALQDHKHLHETLAQVRREKGLLIRGLETMGCAPVPSQTHYFLLPVNDGATFRTALLPYGILVRDCASFNLPQYIRISPRRPAENLCLLEIIQDLLP